MPVPLVALAVAAGGGMVTGYVIDHVIGDSKYTAEEAILDATLGAVGGSLVKPAIRVGGRLKSGVRISAGRPTTFERLAFRAQTEPIMWGSKFDRAAWIALRTGKQSKGDLKTLGKFTVVSGGHSYWLARRGSGAPPSSSPTGTASRPDTKGAREFLRRQGRGLPQDRKYGGPRQSSKRGGRARRIGKQRCPPGHYWSKRFRKCVRYRKY